MIDESLEARQQYLRSEIIDQGFDPQDFSQFMATVRAGEDLDIEKWTMTDLQNVVQAYKSKIAELQQQPNQKEQITQKIPESNDINPSEYTFPQQPGTPEKIEKNDINNNPAETQKISEKSQEKNQTNITKSQSQTENIKKLPNATAEIQKKSSDKITQSFKNLVDPFESHEETIKCLKLSPNELTNRNDLFVTISNPRKINPGIFYSSYFQYTVTTSPLNYKVVRKLDDFTFLYNKLPLLYPGLYNPLLPSFEFGLKDDSPKKMSYIQNYMNAIVEHNFYRSLPIVYEFLTLAQADWNKKRIIYNNTKEVGSFSKMTNLKGEIHININKEQDTKAMKIKDDINKKSVVYDSLNAAIDDLLANLEKLSTSMNNVSSCFKDLRNTYRNNDLLSNIFNRLFTLTNIWSKDLLKQSDYFRVEIKQYFRYMSKENTAFLKIFDDFRLGRDDYKSKFEKVKKNLNKTKKDFDELNNIRQYYGYLLCNVNYEYQKLEERQAIRTWSKFLKYNDNKDIILQNFYNCIKLFNLKEEIPTETKKKDEKGKIQKKESENEIKDGKETDKNVQGTST